MRDLMNWTPVTASSHPTVYRAMYLIDVIDNGATPVVAYYVPPEFAMLLAGAEAAMAELGDEELETFCIGEDEDMARIRARSPALQTAHLLLDAFFGSWWPASDDVRACPPCNGDCRQGRDCPAKHEPLSVTAERFWGISTIYGRDEEHATPYMTRAWIGRLRLHVFHRGDADQDHHDHPWDFWTLPLHSYVEDVVHHAEVQFAVNGQVGVEGHTEVRRQVVEALKVHFRPAEHTHRVLGRYDAEATSKARTANYVIPGESFRLAPRHKAGRVVTLVWRGGPRRAWGFLKSRDGRWCWVAWRDYVFGGGKDAPCS